MATTITDDADLTYLSFPIEKSKTTITADGDVIVYGKATDGIVDSDDQIVDPVWAAKAVAEWLETGGNIRVQHQAMRDPAGVGLEVTRDEHGGQWVKALIVEPVAKNLVLKGVLRSYSIGIMHPTIVPDQLARNGRIVGGEMGELSLVDRPANKNCKFELVKRAKDGGAQWVGKMFGKPVATPSYLAAMAAAKRETDTVEKVGPHGYEHGWVHMGVGGEAASATSKHPESKIGADASRAVTGGHAADHVMTGQKKPKDLSDKDLKDADTEFARRATALGKKGQVSGSHRKVKNEIARRKAAKKDARIDVGKREFDRSVGGGVDRDQIPESDFAGPDRSFPIVTPKDVADIAPNLNHTGHDPEQVKRNAIRIARRKGPAFVANIPDSWTKGSMPELSDLVLKAGAVCPGCDHINDAKASTCAKCDAKMAAGDDEDILDKGLENLFGAMIVPDLAKGDSDDDDDDDTSPGDTGADTMDDRPQHDDDDSDDDDSDDDSDKSVSEPDVAKGKMKCAKCSGFMKAKQKFCPGCGAKKPAPAVVDKSARTRPTPADGVTGQHADPVPEHREPDGHAVESFEADAKIPTDPDAEYKTAMHQQTLGVPRDMAVLHDLLCPVYHPEVTGKTYPGLSLSEAVAVDDWQMKAMDAAAEGTLAEAQAATKRWKEASVLAQTDAEVIEELRHGAFKMFADANIGPGTFPTPTTVTPGQFKRPYLTGGHARPSFQQAGPNTAKVPVGQISAEDFDRGPLTAGHAADSPANKTMTRTHYTNTQRENARAAMQAMHDHIGHMFPDICALGETVAEPAATAPVPDAVGKAVKPQKTAKADKAAVAAPAELTAQVEMLTKAFTPDALKAAFASVTEPLTAQLAEASVRMKNQDKKIKSLTKALDVLAKMPDPTTAPWRGVAQPGALKSYGVQAASPSPAEIAARTQLSLMADLESEYRTSTDPSAREAAWYQLCKMRGITD